MTRLENAETIVARTSNCKRRRKRDNQYGNGAIQIFREENAVAASAITTGAYTQVQTTGLLN